MAKPIPKVITSGGNLLPTNDHGANGTGIDNGEGYRVQGHADLQKMTEPYSARRAAFNPHGEKLAGWASAHRGDAMNDDGGLNKPALRKR